VTLGQGGTIVINSRTRLHQHTSLATMRL